MNPSFAPKIGLALLLNSFTILQLAQAADVGSAPGEHPSCREMMAKAMPIVANMPAGVEKMAAQKEIASAQLKLDKGAETECKTHVHNATQAIRAHGTN